MSEELLIKHCSPTLAGLKTANLFSCAYTSRKEVNAQLRKLNRKLGGKGLRAVVLRYTKDRALIYVYRPSMLKEDLNQEKARKILKRSGYAMDNPDTYLPVLARKLQQEPDFPHEIGLFLGYPPEDVEGFIVNHAEHAKCSGCWKVYGDEEKARRQFARYKKCTDIYCRQWSMGKSIERLTVAV